MIILITVIDWDINIDIIDRTAAAEQTPVIIFAVLPIFPVMIKSNKNIMLTIARIAVINGKKFAYPYRQLENNDIWRCKYSTANPPIQAIMNRRMFNLCQTVTVHGLPDLVVA